MSKQWKHDEPKYLIIFILEQKQNDSNLTCQLQHQIVV